MAQTPPPINPAAIIPFVGMYTMPIRLMDAAKMRGGNLLMKWESQSGTVSQADWRAAARERGFYYCDQYMNDDDLGDPFLLAWLLPNSDEFNRVRGSTLPNPAPLYAEITRLRALNASLPGGAKPIMANMDGQAITTALFEKPPYNGIRGNEVPVGRLLDIRCFDDYPVTNTAANTPEQIARRPMYLPAQALLRLQTWFDADTDATAIKPGEYACIMEASANFKAPLTVTGAQMRAQRDYILGRTPFPFPADPIKDGSKSVMTTIKRLPKIWVWWTANGQDGPGFKWIAQSDEQANVQAEITAELLATNVTPAPPVPPIVDYVKRSELQALADELRSTVSTALSVAGKAAEAAELASQAASKAAALAQAANDRLDKLRQV